ncbi:HK97 family phage prohead protease [Anaerostipes sp. PC18]|uniref:HK97 family phage prohead protease n=1 Tax=Anaerostipes sp. PC18 TaxID=3036926 RepID=UPI003084C0D5|nr:HK97 family phage prohead protease [Anaerostipes sp. PC18]
MDKYDFSGWATRHNLRCSDGRVILKDAFKKNDGQKVPLVWNHQHNDPFNVLGHALLENRGDGVYAYCSLNDTEAGNQARAMVQHGDIDSLSIFANQLEQNGTNVVHGNIREVSLVMASANPGAFIDSVIAHSDGEDEVEARIYTGELISLCHSSEEEEDKKETLDENKEDDEETKTTESDATVEDIFETLTEKQKEVVYAMIGQLLGESNTDETEKKGDGEMKHNVFDSSEKDENVLSHDALKTILKDAKRQGSLKESFLVHAADYGIENIDYLFPDAKNVTETPSFIQRDMNWVQKVMNGTHHVPFSRIKSIHADITEDDARAKGYIKGNMKKEEVFGLLKRSTSPTTVYKKQKMDRDDILDITDFSVVTWLKSEMRLMLDEEIARACLVGDGRSASSDDKINELNIRPIWKDDDLYTIKTEIDGATNTTADDRAKAFIKASIKSRKNYKGTGNPTMFTTEDMLTDCLLLEDKNGRAIYDTVEKLTTALRVKEIVTVPVMEDLTRNDESGNTLSLMGIIVNLDDYRIGVDKGGAINMFDDFDIDYNQEKYLIETRCSGALTVPYSAIALELKTTQAAG